MSKFEKIVAWMPHTGLYLPNVDNRPEFDILRRDSLLLADEQVDRLYGITMQEKGVSTLVSVNLIDKDLDD